MRDNFPIMMGISKNLRANLKKRYFARNRELHFTGKSQENAVLPVTGDWILRANLKNRRFARNGGLHFTGKSQETPFCP